MTTKPALVLLTMNYPESVGDSSFVASEIAGLTRRHRVFVVPLLHEVTRREPLPDGVTALPAVFTSRRQIATKGLWNRSSLSLVADLMRDDASALTSVSSIRSIALASLMGRAVASHRPLRRVMAAFPNAPLYFFWGTGMAYAIPWLRGSGHPVIVRLHRGDLYEETAAGYLPFRRRVFEAATLLLAISRHGVEHLGRVVHDLGIDVPIRLNRLGTRDEGLRPPRPPSAPIHMVSCSAVIPVKRVTAILGAAVELSRTRPVRWTHFGGGAGLRELTAATATAPATLTAELMGQRANAEIHHFYRQTYVDCFVNVSSSEGLPVSIMEACSHGIPVVATDVGGTSDLVGAVQGTGLLVPAGASAVTVADAVVAIVDRLNCDLDPRGYWERHHNSDRQAEELSAMLAGLSR